MYHTEVDQHFVLHCKLQSCLATAGAWSKECGTIQMLKVEVWNVTYILSNVFLLTY